MRLRTLSLCLLAFALLIPEGASAARIVVKREPGLSTAERADIRADAGVRLLERVRLDRTEVVTAPAGETERALRELRADPDVEYAVLDRPVYASSNDPYFPDLWGLQELFDHDLDVPEAWAATTGTGLTVAVVDSGVDATHPDLSGHIIGGHDFVDDDSDPDDLDGHGTHVSGTVVAKRDNGIGIVGVAPDATVHPMRVLDENGEGDGMDAAAAFDYAGDHGIRVANASFGAEGFFAPEYEAIEAHPETLYVVAAGNGGPDHIGDDNDGPAPDYPCSYDLANIICVGASNDEDARPSFSNYGAESVDLFAPGVGIWSTTEGGYQPWNGTSMAAPHVTGIAALLLARNPTLTTAQLKSAILNGADPVAAFSGLSVTGARANANDAVALVPGTTGPGPADSDGDGVVDTSDGCPTQAGPAPSGCPAAPPDGGGGTPPSLDKDGDGRSDASDGCPNVRALTADGCPLPAFSALSKKVSSCRTGKRCTRSVRVSVRADRAATVRVTVERKSCKKGKRCRWVRVARKSVVATSSSKTARVTVKPLRRGAHRAIVKLTSSAGTSKPRTLSFKVR